MVPPEDAVVGAPKVAKLPWDQQEFIRMPFAKGMSIFVHIPRAVKHSSQLVLTARMEDSERTCRESLAVRPRRYFLPPCRAASASIRRSSQWRASDYLLRRPLSRRMDGSSNPQVHRGVAREASDHVRIWTGRAFPPFPFRPPALRGLGVSSFPGGGPPPRTTPPPPGPAGRWNQNEQGRDCLSLSET